MENLKSYNSMLAEKKLSGQDYINSEFRDLSLIGDLDNLKHLLNHGNDKLLVADVNSKNPYAGMAALHNAAFAGHKKIVEFLLDNGADIDQEDFSGDTPLSYAVERKKRGVSKLLISRGADPFKVFAHPQSIVQFFKGDINWMPEHLKEKINRAIKVRGLFGK